jgi:8-oxo-dGTP diphosphatase
MHDALLTIAVAVVVRDGSVLVGRRDPHALDAAGLREFPGGKVERGETPAAAAVREVREETGLEIRIGRLLETARAESHAGPIEIFFLAGEPIDPAASPGGSFTWVPIEHLDDRSFPTANQRVLAALRRPPRPCQGGS